MIEAEATESLDIISIKESSKPSLENNNFIENDCLTGAADIIDDNDQSRTIDHEDEKCISSIHVMKKQKIE